MSGKLTLWTPPMLCPQALRNKSDLEIFSSRVIAHTALIISVLLKPALAKALVCATIPSVGPGTPLGPGPGASIRPALSLIIGEFGSHDRTASAKPNAIMSAVEMRTVEKRLNYTLSAQIEDAISQS
jgi:hypothetical protein